MKPGSARESIWVTKKMIRSKALNAPHFKEKAMGLMGDGAGTLGRIIQSHRRTEKKRMTKQVEYLRKGGGE